MSGGLGILAAVIIGLMLGLVVSVIIAESIARLYGRRIDWRHWERRSR